jgi:hypothetical protein
MLESLDKLLTLVMYCHKGKNLKKKTSSSDVIVWYRFIKGIVSFTWISKIVQYSNTVCTSSMDVGLSNHVKNQVCNLSSLFSLL